MHGFALLRNGDQLNHETAHRAAGSCMYIGALKLGYLYRTVEEAAKCETWDEVSEIISETEHCISETLLVVSRL